MKMAAVVAWGAQETSRKMTKERSIRVVRRVGMEGILTEISCTGISQGLQMTISILTKKAPARFRQEAFPLTVDHQ